MGIETEIKLRLPHGAGDLAGRLKRMGYHESSPRGLEVDQVFDLPGNILRLSGRLLRLRLRGSEWTLTYKGPVIPGRHKSREEIESKVGDGPALEAIFEGIGLVRSWRYEKYRTKFRRAAQDGAGEVTLDETPIGDFVELEGPEYWIDEMAASMGFGVDEYITKSYSTLYQEFLLKNAGASGDMTF